MDDVAGDDLCAVEDYVFHLVCAHVAVGSSPGLFTVSQSSSRLKAAEIPIMVAYTISFKPWYSPLAVA